MTVDQLEAKLRKLYESYNELVAEHNELARSVELIEYALVHGKPLDSLTYDDIKPKPGPSGESA
jgi:hypothetical protein